MDRARVIPTSLTRFDCAKHETIPRTPLWNWRIPFVVFTPRQAQDHQIGRKAAMSSDSDIDEDELLQIALKEQAQRDRNYQKTQRSSKPVINYLQPPPPPPTFHQAPQKNPNQAQKPRRAIENDDSEVEMLSISSGDEDSSKKNEGRKPRSDERQWIGEEPRCWKQVDEAELARSVRDMRETRKIPAIRVPDQTTKKMMTASPSFHRGLEFMDPLGLGIIDTKSLRLMTDTTEIPNNQDANLREKLKYNSEKFDPKLFLSRIHGNTSESELEDGSMALNADLEGRTKQKKLLVKENFDCFVSCKTTIDDIESKLRRIEEHQEGEGTTHLLSCIERVNSLANEAFQPLFERQAQAEKIRSVQGVLQRFRTLFNLPSTIRASIVNGEYDLAVREYQKAKSIVLPSHITALKRVLEEVEKVMKEFKKSLYKSMKDSDLSANLVENIVRLLIELEPESDPVWYYLELQNSKIREALQKCTAEHESRMEKKLGFEEVDRLLRRYISSLTSVISHRVPALWKVAASVFKLAKSSNSNEEGRCTRQFSDMISATISIYSTKVKNSFRDFDVMNALRPFMADVMKEIYSACRAFRVKEISLSSGPDTAALHLQILYCEVAKVYIFKLCSWMRSSVEDISGHQPVTTILEKNRSNYRISSSPLSFRSVVVSAMDRIDSIVQLISEFVASDEQHELQEVRESSRLAFFNCFLDFAVHLERYSSDMTLNELDNISDSNPNPYQVLLIILSDIGFCKDELSYDLYQKYKQIWIRFDEEDEDKSDINDLIASFAAVETKTLAKYSFHKSSVIRTAATNYLVNSGLPIGASSITGVRDAAVDLLHAFVAVHAEVFAGAKHLLDRTIGVLVEALIDTFLGILRENKSDLKSIDANGFCQLMLEIEYFETVLNPYFTPEARASLKSLQSLLLERAAESVSVAVEKIDHRRRGTRGSDDTFGEDKHHQGSEISADDLIALAQQYSSELLEKELERTRVNTACFVESMPLDSVPESARAAAYAPARGLLTDSPRGRSRRTPAGVSPVPFRHRRA